MTQPDYNLIATSIWRSGFIKDKNQVRQLARSKMQQLIAIDIAASLAHANPDFNREQFMHACGVSDV